MLRPNCGDEVASFNNGWRFIGSDRPALFPAEASGNYHVIFHHAFKLSDTPMPLLNITAR